jgi:hypothetical protein
MGVVASAVSSGTAPSEAPSAAHPEAPVISTEAWIAQFSQQQKLAQQTTLTDKRRRRREKKQLLKRK